jgi:hypothetical protein
VIRRQFDASTGQVISVPLTAEEIAEMEAVGAASPPISLTRHSWLEFRGRFTEAEQAAIMTAALSNAALFSWLLDGAGAQFIDTADPRTIAGVQSLVSANLLTSERAAEILA